MSKIRKPKFAPAAQAPAPAIVSQIPGGILLLLIAAFLCLAAPRASALTINPIFDSSITTSSSAAAIEATIDEALRTYETLFSNPITISIDFVNSNTGLGSSVSTYQEDTYTDFLAKLTADQTTANNAIAIAHLPGGPNNPVDNNPDMNLTVANEKALGIVTTFTGPVSTIYLNTSITNITRSGALNPDFYDLFAVVSHEVDEVLGTGSSLPNGSNGQAPPIGPIEPMDLFRYDQNGNRSYTTSSNAEAFFSLDGTTDIIQFNQISNSTNSGDYGDYNSFTPPTIPRVQDAYGTPGAILNLGVVEKTSLNVIGYNLLTSVTWDPTSSGTSNPPDGSGNWPAGNQWFNGSSDVTWTNGSNAQFGSTNMISGSSFQVTVNANTTVGTMTFADQNYTVSTTGSAQLTVNSGIIAVSNATLTSASSNQLILGGDNAWDAVGSAVLTVTADVSGPFALTKQGPGTLALDATNTYTGATTVQEGTLTLNSSSALPTGGNVIVSGGVLDLNGHSPTIGNLTFGDGHSTLAATFGDSAAVQGSATLNGNITYSWTVGTSYFPAATLSANLLLASGTHQITTADPSISANYDIVISGTMSGSGGIEKDGVNYIALAAANTYSGPTAINNGWLFLTATDAIPSNSDIIVNSPGVLSLNPTNLQTGVTTGNYNQSAGSLAGNGQIELGSATLAVGNDNSSTAYSGSIFGSGGLTKTGTGTLTISSALSYTGTTFINSGAIQISTNGGLSGVVSGSNGGILIYNWGSNSVLMSNTLTGGVGLTQAGSGGLYVTGASSYTGTTSISSGAIYIGDGSTTGSLGTGPVVNNGTLYFYRSNSFTVGNAISGSGNLYQDGAGTVTLTGSNSYLGSTLLASGFFQLGNGGATGSLPGSSTVQGNSGTGLVFDRGDNITVGNSIISGIGVTQSGSGSVTLTAAESYTGPTTVTSGSLVINGSISGSPTTVSGGTLGGNGTLGSVSILSGGAILPATSGTVGLLSLGNFSLASGGTFDIQLDGTTGTGTAAVSYDELKTAGTVTLGGAVQLSIMSGFTPVIGDVFYAILNDSSDTVSGTFSNAVGDTLTFPGGYTYTVNYAASGYSTSNDVSFTLIAIPEPSLPASLATGLLLLGGYFRIRRPSKRQRISGARYAA